ncbi:MAG: hypothetical protein AB3N09_12270, partial [Tateyamaria sp.]
MTAVTAVEAALTQRRRKWLPVIWIFLAAVIVALFFAIGLIIRVAQSSTPHYRDIDQHFRHGSIGAETSSGIPYKLWKAMPILFPEAFPTADYESFGYIYDGTKDLPIGISKRRVNGVDLVWFNCAVCHTGIYRESEDAPPRIVTGMPAHRLDLYAFTAMVLTAASDPRLAPDNVREAMTEAGVGLGPIENILWKVAVFPRLREGMIDRASRLHALLGRQPAWARGRVDTFNPYKVLEFDWPAHSLADNEVVGASDFPSIFLQGPRDGMQLHWDGNNPSLAERNLSAALGAGVTPETVDHASIERIADWLLDLPPPASPHKPAPDAVVRGQSVYMRECADCHGWQSADGYVFEGAYLGTVTPLEEVGTDPNRLHSYTQAFRDEQVAELFKGTPYAFRHFQKTDGYSNAPLDGLWLRGPYLHNGSVP